MKKFLFALLAVFGLCFITYNPVHASSVAIPFSDVPALYYSFGTIAAGGTINLEDYDNPQDYIADLNRLLRGQEIKNNHYGMTSKTSKTLFNTLASMALNGITELSEDGSLIITYDNTNTAQFMSYDKNYYKYLIAIGEDVIVPTPDENFISTINFINDVVPGGFYWKNWTGDHVSDANSYTWCNYYSYNNQGMTADWYNWQLVRDITISPIITVNIDGSGSSWDMSISNYNNTLNYWDNQFHVFNTSNSSITNRWIGSTSGIFWPSDFTTTFNSLNNAFTFLSNNFRNINIYVNGVLWALAGDISISNPPILSPDVIGVGDLPDDTYGVLGLNEPVNLDLGAFLGWLNDIFDLGKDVIGLGDLVDEGDLPFLRTRDTDTDIDLDDTNVIPAEQVIDDPKEKEEEDEDTDPDPDPDPDPPFPAPLPPVLPIPDPNITPRQTTVLSEIIQATDTVVPSELMTLIWSTFGLLVVGGLIYILHK